MFRSFQYIASDFIPTDAATAMSIGLSGEIVNMFIILAVVAIAAFCIFIFLKRRK